MLSAPHIANHRSLHVLRASLVSQFDEHNARYHANGSILAKGVCRGLHQAVKEIDALLDDGPTVLAADRDWADAIENTRLAGRDPGEDACDRQDGSHTRPARMVGAWGQLIGYACFIVIGAIYCLLQMKGER